MATLEAKQLGFGVIGCGHWGPNHVRNFNSIPGCTVRRVSDLSQDRLKAIKAGFPATETTTNAADVIGDEAIQAVIIATPVKTHFALVKQALQAGKHVLCEKPLTLLATESEELVQLAKKHGRVLMVGHVFLFNPGVLYLKKQLEEKKLGQLYYLDAVRTNLGPIRQDVGAIYDLASHDISIFNFLLGSLPLEGSAQVGHFVHPDREDVAYLTLRYPDGIMCHVHVSWLNPQKLRQLTLVGEGRMAVWDDMQPLEPIRLYDKGFEQKPFYNSFGEFQMILRDADINIPKVKMFEPLMRQAQHFVECIRQNSTPIADGRTGLDVVLALEACLESAKCGGKMIPVRNVPREPS